MALFNSSASESLYRQKTMQQQVKCNLEQVKLETSLVLSLTLITSVVMYGLNLVQIDNCCLNMLFIHSCLFRMNIFIIILNNN